MITRRAVAPAYLAACLLLGGASAAGFLANLVLQLAALPIIGWALWAAWYDRPSGVARSILLLLGVATILLAAQLAPLPPSIWASLPGRAAVRNGFILLGQPLPWLPISLAPADTIASLLWLLPAISVLLAMVTLGAFRGFWIAVVILVVTALSVALGALQVVGGRAAGAYLYRITNYGQAVGFFANSNHTASLLLVAMPFLGAVQTSLLKRSRSPRNVSAVRVLTGATFVVILVGLLTNFSLAGLGLGVPVALLSLAAFGGKRTAVRPWLLALIGFLSLAAIVTIVIGPFGNNLIGNQRDYAQLSRQTSFRLTLKAAAEYFPFGSGVGTFQPVYRTQEPLRDVLPVFMNHAHSDWLELPLETGLVGLALAGAFLFWWAVRTAAIWRASAPDFYARAATIASGTLLLHSAVDYPLRTAALSAVFAACVGLMSDVRPFTRRSGRTPTARHLTL